MRRFVSKDYFDCAARIERRAGLWSGGEQCWQSNAAANGAQQATPTFRASSRLVLVDVVVPDKAGQTVKGLNATDFTILEDGEAATDSSL